MKANLPTELSHKYFLTAGECNAEGRMPLTLITQRVIETATEHANAIGVGYADLIKQNMGWVLSRLSIEMARYPGINEEYTLTTWIEAYNRRFSQRNFRMTDAAGNVVGYMRTIWVAIDFSTRTMADLESFEKEKFPIGSIECPMKPMARLQPIGDKATEDKYTFRYCDIDFNRHVNTVRYLTLILNHWPIEHFDNNSIRRIDIMFRHESHFGEEVLLRVDESDPTKTPCAIVRDGVSLVEAQIEWNNLKNQ